jgi:large subunit ribosomal protein L3
LERYFGILTKLEHERKYRQIKLMYPKVSDESHTTSTEVVFCDFRMLNSILATKGKQTQEFTPEGVRTSVTWLTVGPCYITQIRKIGARPFIQIGMGNKKNLTKPETGHLKKAGLTQKLRFLRQIELDAISENWKVGDQINIGEIFSPGDKISVTGTGSGKGFAGVVKRHHFRGGPRTHGQSDKERSPGSIGMTTTPGRVFRGKRMAGRMGGGRVTVNGLKVISVDTANHLMKITGLVPGKANGLLTVTRKK